MIKGKNVKRYCCEDISLIENYNEAINSDEMWQCHHRLEIELNKSKQELIDIDLYYNRPASELIFLTRSEHKALHMSVHRKNGILPTRKGKDCNFYGVHKFGKDNPMYGKTKILYIWKLPDGTTKIMDMTNAHRWHPDWIKIGEV